MKNLPFFHALDGKFLRKGRGEAVVAGAPTAPTAVKVSQSADVATVTWGPPTSDGGSPITGYRVAREGGTSQDVAATARSASFAALSTTTDHTFTVAALNAVGASPTVTVLQDNTPVITTVRFPGDPGKKSGTVLWGIDEFDKDPTVKLQSEDATPELLTGTAGNRVRAAGIREYFNGWGSFGNGGGVWNAITGHHNKGRLPWVSCNQTKGETWGAQLTGAKRTAMIANFDYFIDRVESLQYPVWATLLHEPENQTNSKGGTDGTEAEWLEIQKVFRSRMDEYEKSHGGLGNYIWKNLAFANCMTAYCYFEAGKAGGIDRYIPSQSAANIFDFCGADYYVWTVGAPLWGGNIKATVAWCQKYGKALGLAEWGIHHENNPDKTKPQAGAMMQDFYNRCLDPVNDIIAAFYYNSAVSATSRALSAQRWMLNNGGTFTYTGDSRPQPVTYTNGNLLDKYVSLLKNTKSVHFWDLTNPSTGNKYPKPTGATF